MNKWLALFLCAALVGGCAARVPPTQSMGGPPDEGAAVAASLGYHGPPDRDSVQGR